MHKAIGLITCASVMAVSLYLFSGGDPSRTLSAQTDSASTDSYGSVARRFMQDARAAAEKGNLDEARRIAATADSLSTEWAPGEQTPGEFLKTLPSGKSTGTGDSLAAADWASLEEATGLKPADNPFADAVAAVTEEPAGGTSGDLLRKRQAQRLVAEARQALAGGNLPLARSRALQARQLNAAWGLWDDRPEHVINEIDKLDRTQTFAAGAAPAAASRPESDAADAAPKPAAGLLKQARLAMDAGDLARAKQLSEQAAAGGEEFGMFEDSPELVQRDLERLAAADPAGDELFGGAPAEQSPAAAQARQLLRDAREAMAKGRLSAAREKATQAKNLNVSYGLLDDRPELVLHELDPVLRGQGNRTAPAAAVAAAPVAAAKSTPVTSAQARPRKSESGAIAPVNFESTEELGVLRPDGVAAEIAYNRGIELFRKGDRKGAKDAFQTASRNAGDLDFDIVLTMPGTAHVVFAPAELDDPDFGVTAVRFDYSGDLARFKKWTTDLDAVIALHHEYLVKFH